MRRNVYNFLRARLAEADRRLAKLRLQRRAIESGKIVRHPNAWRYDQYDLREARLSKLRKIILRRLRDDEG